MTQSFQLALAINRYASHWKSESQKSFKHSAQEELFKLKFKSSGNSSLFTIPAACCESCFNLLMMKKPINQFFIASSFTLTTISINPHRHAKRNKWFDHCLALLMMVKRVFSRMSEKHKSLCDDTNWFKSEVNGLVLCAVLAEQCLHKFVLPSSINCLNICPLEGGWLNWWRLFKLLRNKDGQGELPTYDDCSIDEALFAKTILTNNERRQFHAKSDG